MEFLDRWIGEGDYSERTLCGLLRPPRLSEVSVEVVPKVISEKSQGHIVTGEGLVQDQLQESSLLPNGCCVDQAQCDPHPGAVREAFAEPVYLLWAATGAFIRKLTYPDPQTQGVAKILLFM